MSKVRFRAMCDRCGKPSPEYVAWPICNTCGDDVCPACANMATHEPETGTVDCNRCEIALTISPLDLIYLAEMSDAMEGAA